MNNQTKTSNEDLIEEICSTRCENGRLIDIDENKSIRPISKSSNHLVDLNVLAQFCDLNSENDQMYKRILNPPPSKICKSLKKSLDLYCVICEDRAIGFNYDALTCASCKAFFRRNAQYDPTKLRCLTGEKNCSVLHNVHRKCQRCRLSKCLLMGMRKDFILSEEEKQRRRQRIEENRQLSTEYHSYTQYISLPINDYVSPSVQEIDRLLMDTDNDNVNQTECNNIESRLSEDLSIEDWSDIENIRSNYSLIFEMNNVPYCKFDLSDQISALISWSEFASEKSLKLIQFFQQIEEFENLNNDDRFTLIKYNLLTLYIIQKCCYYNPLTGRFGDGNSEESFKRRQFFRLCYGESGIRESFKDLIHSLSSIIEQDSTLIKILLIILLFSKGLSMNENETILNDELAVNRAQSHYIRLIWNYLVSKQGQIKACKQMTQLMREIGRIQTYTKHYREFFHAQIQSRDALERFAPLMQAVLNIA